MINHPPFLTFFILGVDKDCSHSYRDLVFGHWVGE